MGIAVQGRGIPPRVLIKRPHAPLNEAFVGLLFGAFLSGRAGAAFLDFSHFDASLDASILPTCYGRFSKTLVAQAHER